ncbi:hypothetical protein D047_1297A, partial [Vibrio parahaemolyticus VPTS-2010_2]
MAGFFF